MIQVTTDRSPSQPDRLREKPAAPGVQVQDILQSTIAAHSPAGTYAVQPRRDNSRQHLTFGPTRIGGPSA